MRKEINSSPLAAVENAARIIEIQGHQPIVASCQPASAVLAGGQGSPVVLAGCVPAQSVLTGCVDNNPGARH